MASRMRSTFKADSQELPAGGSGVQTFTLVAGKPFTLYAVCEQCGDQTALASGHNAALVDADPSLNERLAAAAGFSNGKCSKCRQKKKTTKVLTMPSRLLYYQHETERY